MIGRKNEIGMLQEALDSKQSEFVALYGRRRVGKTFLVTEFFNGRFAFHHSGLENATLKESLSSFREALRHQGHPKCPRFSTSRVPQASVAAIRHPESRRDDGSSQCTHKK